MGRLLAAAALVIAGCAAPTPAATSTSSAVAPPTAAAATAAPTAAPATPTPAPTPKPKFPAGLYIVRPSLQHPGGTVELVEPAGTLPAIELVGVGWDVRADAIVGSSPQQDGVTLYYPDGTKREVKIPGIYQIGRAALSPDATQVLVQGSQTKVTIGPTPPPVGTVLAVDTVWIADLATGAVRRIGDAPDPSNTATQSELPVWFPSGDRVAYWTTENQCLVIKVRDTATAKDVLTIRKNGTSGCYQPQRGILDGPRFHVAVSADSSKILIPGQMQVYDARTGTLIADVHKQVMDGLAAAGYKPDARFPGQAGGGTFPLDGTFAPDGKTIAFDGAVEKDGAFGVLLCKINVDGTGFSVHKGPFAVEPRFSNNHNFSQVLPRWLTSSASSASAAASGS